CCRKEIAEQVGEILVCCARESAEFYGFRVPLDADYTIGHSWAGDPAPADERGVNDREHSSHYDCRDPEPAPTNEQQPESQPEPAPQPKPQAHSSGNGHDRDGYTTTEQTGGTKEDEYIYSLLNGDLYLKVVKMRKPDGKKYFPQYRREKGRWVK